MNLNSILLQNTVNHAVASRRKSEGINGLSALELILLGSSLPKREVQAVAELLQHRQQQQQRQDEIARAMALMLHTRNRSILQSQASETIHDPTTTTSLPKPAMIPSAVAPRHPLMPGSKGEDVKLSLDTNKKRRLSNESFDSKNKDVSPPTTNVRYFRQDDLSSETDVLLGRGIRAQQRISNIEFRKLIATYQDIYDQATSNEEKKTIVDKISGMLSKSGFRFFKESDDLVDRNTGHKLWTIISDRDVQYKIKHSFRSGRKGRPKESKENEPRAAATESKEGNSRSKSPTVTERKNTYRSTFKEDKITERCICVGSDKGLRNEHTQTEGYRYFQDLVRSFDSVFGAAGSMDERVQIADKLIDTVKSSEKGYRFVKLGTHTKSYVPSSKQNNRFCTDASLVDVHFEVFSILGDGHRTPESTKSATTKLPVKKRNRSSNSLKELDDESCSHSSLSSHSSLPPKKRRRPSSEHGTPKENATPSQIYMI